MLSFAGYERPISVSFRYNNLFMFELVLLWLKWLFVSGLVKQSYLKAYNNKLLKSYGSKRSWWADLKYQKKRY